MTIRVLTDTEERVAELVAAGRSDRQIAAELGLISATVEWHLSCVYRKLGARSRDELAAVLARDKRRVEVRARRRQ